jgi:hypothetical protein
MFPCTNNAAEYEALLHGLRMAKDMYLSRVRCLGDSDLVAQQVSGKWDSKDPLMEAYHRAVDNIAGHFKGCQVDHLDRRKNEAAGALSWLGSQRKLVPPNVFLDVLHNPSVKLPSKEDLVVPDPEAQLVAALRAIPYWTLPYLAYMSRGELPEDETLARQITRRSKSMTIVNGELHRCSVIVYSNIVFLLRRVVTSYEKSMKAIVVIMPAQNLWWIKHFVMGFIG